MLVRLVNRASRAWRVGRRARLGVLGRPTAPSRDLRYFGDSLFYTLFERRQTRARRTESRGAVVLRPFY
jgi:hypothetical protein